MPGFGLEIRKRNAVNLFKDVDHILSKTNLETFAKDSVAHALHKMFQGDWFDICTFDKCTKVLALHVPEERYRIYSAQHCVHWNQMLPDFRETFTAMVLNEFRSVFND